MTEIAISYDEAKRLRTLVERGLDFRDAPKIFLAPHFQLEDEREYGEQRLRVYGWLDGRRVVMVWTPREQSRRIISMRHAHEEEFEAFERGLGRS